MHDHVNDLSKTYEDGLDSIDFLKLLNIGESVRLEVVLSPDLKVLPPATAIRIFDEGSSFPKIGLVERESILCGPRS